MKPVDRTKVLEELHILGGQMLRFRFDNGPLLFGLKKFHDDLSKMDHQLYRSINALLGLDELNDIKPKNDP